MSKWLCKIFGHKFYRINPLLRNSPIDHWMRCKRCGHIETYYK